jgi:hypothetical protein
VHGVDLLGPAFKNQAIMDGRYDPSVITFVPTKTDDVSCSEVIRDLDLEDDPEVNCLSERLSRVLGEERRMLQRKLKRICTLHRNAVGLDRCADARHLLNAA